MKTEGERISDIISHFCESKADFARKMEESGYLVVLVKMYSTKFYQNSQM